MAQNTLVYDRWFAFADTDRDGRVTGKDAVSFFEKSGLPRDVLAKVWDMANSGRQGYLDRMSFHKAMDLISLAQQVRQRHACTKRKLHVHAAKSEHSKT
ncbi:uncharacterized protein HaLaN_06682, partial [Haematococcus lacustris]